jgi:hypothetical protein
MAGSIVTFYSFKGGVGRTFAVANIAVILAQWGYRVLAVDWDIEAPGLHHYFTEYAPSLPPGVLNFLEDCSQDSPRTWDAYVRRISIPGVDGHLALMPASAIGEGDYVDAVQRLAWDNLYLEHDLGARLETLRAAWIQNFDVVLLDSRTGVTDFSGLTTAQLPDVLAFLFTANNQSLLGCCDIARRAMEARRKLPVDRPALIPLPLPAKFELHEEYDRAQFWRAQFAKELAPFFNVWAPSTVDPTTLVEILTIPYVARWTFGEDLAALVEPPSSSGTRTAGLPMSYALETIAAVIANGFGKIDLLCSSRDEYIHTARATAPVRAPSRHKRVRIFISYGQDERSVAQQISDVMRKRGMETYVGDDVPVGSSITEALSAELERADALVAVVGSRFSGSTFQATEIERFLRQSLRTDVRKPIIPVLMPGSIQALRDSRLADFVGVSISPDISMEIQLEPLFSRLTALPGFGYSSHSSPFSPDGSRIVTAFSANTARIWDTVEGKQIAVLRGHEDTVQYAAFSPDGLRIVTASWDRTARIWDSATAETISVLRGHGGVVWAAAFSPDGRLIVTASLDKTARIWDAATAAVIAELLGHEESVQSAVFSPDGGRVVTASWDRTARVWDAMTRGLFAVLLGHEDQLQSAAFSPDGLRIVTASTDNTARVWDAATGTEIVVLRGHESEVEAAAFSPDGSRIITASADKTARVWDAATGTEIAVLRGHESEVEAAAFSPDGSRIVTVSNYKTARIWDAATALEIRGLH